jgi:hypothetical protein
VTNVHAGCRPSAGFAASSGGLRCGQRDRTAGHRDPRPAARRPSGGMPGGGGAGNLPQRRSVAFPSPDRLTVAAFPPRRARAESARSR